jgi:glycosyltransferase involved in cell wall biosynthesis
VAHAISTTPAVVFLIVAGSSRSVRNPVTAHRSLSALATARRNPANSAPAPELYDLMTKVRKGPPAALADHRPPGAIVRERSRDGSARDAGGSRMATRRAAANAKVGVLFVGSAILPPLGADTQIHVRILEELDRSTHELHAACVRCSGGAPTPTYEALRRIPDLRLVFVNLGPELCVRTRWGKVRGLIATLPAVGSIARLARYTRRNRIDVLHASDRPRDAATCVLLGRLTGAKSVIHCHNAHGVWMSRLLRWALQRADARIAVSDAVAETYLETGHDPATTHTIHNAVDLAGWVPGRGRDEARSELGIPDGAPVVITVCRLFPSKGTAELIRAVATLRREHPDIRLLVVGRDLSPDGSFKRELTRLTTDLDVERNVIFTGHRHDVADLMAASDVFAMPSVWEPFGLVYAEAMAMELPVVALNTGGTPEVVEHARSGLLSEPGNQAKLTENLSRLLRDAELRRQMGAYGRRRVEESFTPDRLAASAASVFRLVASARIGGSEHLEGGGPCGPSRPLLSSRSSTP